MWPVGFTDVQARWKKSNQEKIQSDRLHMIDIAWWEKFRLALTVHVNVGQRSGCRRKSGEGSYRCEATPNAGRSLHKVRFTLVVGARHRGLRSLHSRHHSDTLCWLPRRSARRGIRASIGDTVNDDRGFAAGYFSEAAVASRRTTR